MKRRSPKIVIYTDLDVTLLDEKYSFGEVEPIVRQLLSLKAAIVLASSKTRWEVDYYRKALGLSDPFIVENGSAIIIPRNFFKTTYGYSKREQGYNVIELGISYSVVRKKLALVKEKTGTKLAGFGDMSTKELAKNTGLPFRLVPFAKKREYDEPFKIIEGDEKTVLDAITAEGLCYTKGGGYYHALGRTDKGKAAAVLNDLYLQEYDEIVTIAVGDNVNDLPMLEIVDKSFYIEEATERRTVWNEILSLAEAYCLRSKKPT